MTELAIREASEADLPAILRAYNEAGLDHGDAFTVEEARPHFAALRRYPYYKVFVAEADDMLVGAYALIILDNLAKRGAKSAVVESVAVLPAHQGGGVGRAMMEHAREQCRAAGCYKMALSSNLNREGAHRFYDSLGFERHGYSFGIAP
jgi:GNAT superfamily N-acetyltransferase